MTPALAREGQERVRVLLEDLAHSGTADANGRRIGDLNARWMDQAAIERQGLGSARPYLSRIARARSAKAVQLLMADVGLAAPLNFGGSAAQRRDGVAG